MMSPSLSFFGKSAAQPPMQSGQARKQTKNLQAAHSYKFPLSIAFIQKIYHHMAKIATPFFLSSAGFHPVVKGSALCYTDKKRV